MVGFGPSRCGRRCVAWLGTLVGVMGWAFFSAESGRPSATNLGPSLDVEGSAPASAPHTVAVDLLDDQELQQMVGVGFFGAARPWWKPGPHFSDEFLRQTIEILGATMVRTQIYYDGEPVNDDDDPEHIEWSGFDFGPDTLNGRQFRWLRALAERGGVQVIASVWSPPPWMKRDADDGLADFCHGQCGGQLDPAHRREFAEYLLAYDLALERATGMRLTALSIQNEPSFDNPFESCVYEPHEYLETLELVQRRFAEAGRPMRFFGPEHMGDVEGNERLGWFEALWSERGSSALTAFAVHGYKDGVDLATGTADGWIELRRRSRRWSTPLWMTETSSQHDHEFHGAFHQARALHLALKYGQVEAWVYWYLAPRVARTQDVLGGAAWLDEPLPALLRHYFSALTPGAVQLRTAIDERVVRAVAFRTPPSPTGAILHLVLLNEHSRAKVVLLPQELGGWKDQFLTSEARRFERVNAAPAEGGVVGGGAAGSPRAPSVEVPGRSVVSLRWAVAQEDAAQRDRGFK